MRHPSCRHVTHVASGRFQSGVPTLDHGCVGIVKVISLFFQRGQGAHPDFFVEPYLYQDSWYWVLGNTMAGSQNHALKEKGS